MSKQEREMVMDAFMDKLSDEIGFNRAWTLYMEAKSEVYAEKE